MCLGYVCVLWRLELTRDQTVHLLERDDIGKVSWNLKENCRGKWNTLGR